jgi:hypothetical protein
MMLFIGRKPTSAKFMPPLRGLDNWGAVIPLNMPLLTELSPTVPPSLPPETAKNQEKEKAPEFPN